MTQLEEALKLAEHFRKGYGDISIMARALIEMAEAVEKADHGTYCAVIQRPPGGCDCNCFKSALGVKP